MKGKRMSALATAGLMAMTALAAMPQSAMADEEKTVINIWSKDRHDADYVQKKVDEYNENNTDNIEVNYQLYTDNYTQAVDMAVQSGEMPDILVFQDEMFDKYIGEDQWADLYEFMDDDMKEMFKDVIHEGYNEFDGKLYFIPTTGTTCRLFYNKEIFDRVGIENPPETLEEMVEDAKLITSELAGEGIYGFAENMKSASSGLNRSMIVGLQSETGAPMGYDFEKGEYQWVAQITKELVYADPSNQKARNLCADALEQLGYQAESGAWRNAYLMGAAELRRGNLSKLARSANGLTATMGEMTIAMLLDYIGIMSDANAAQNDDLTLNLTVTDVNEQFYVTRKNGILLSYPGENHPDAQASVTCKRLQLFALMQGQKAGQIQISGDPTVLKRLLAYASKFEKTFNVIEP